MIETHENDMNMLKEKNGECMRELEMDRDYIEFIIEIFKKETVLDLEQVKQQAIKINLMLMVSQKYFIFHLKDL